MSTVLFKEAASGTLERFGNRWRAVLAVPGQGSSGFYSEDVLKEYGPKALAPGAKAFIGHDDERSPKDMIGVYPEGAVYEDGVGLVGDLEVFPHWKEFIETVGPHAGLSIYMMGESDADGNVTKLIPDAMNGVDLVSYPGLEGSGLVEKLYEAAKKKIVEYNKTDDCGPGKRKVDGKCVDIREAAPGELAERDIVEWDYQGQELYGQVAYIMTSGVFPFEGDPLAIEASEESPVALMRIWEKDESGEWQPTDMLMGSPISALEKVDQLEESKRSKKGTVARQPQLTKMEGNHIMDKEEMKAMLSEFGTELVSAISEALNPVEEIVEDEVDMAAVAEAAVKADIPEALRQEIYEAAKGKTQDEAIALVEARKEMVNAIRKSIVDSAPAVSLAEGRVVESGSNVFSLTEITKVAK